MNDHNLTKKIFLPAAYEITQHARQNHPNLQAQNSRKSNHVQITVLNNDPKNEEEKSVTFEVLQNGRIVVVDGVHFLVKKSVAFVDCSVCEAKSMAMTLLPDHLREEHNLEVQTWPA